MESKKPNETITARNIPAITAGTGILLGGVSFWLFGPLLFSLGKTGQFFVPAMSLLLVCVGVSTLASALRQYVRAEKKGLRWRDWRGVHFVPWEKITDFYRIFPEPSLFNPIANEEMTGLEGIGPFFQGVSEVQTVGGAVCRFGRFWSSQDRLSKAIALNAVNATPAISQNGFWEWDLKGARPADFPVTFSYDTGDLHRQKQGFLWTSVISVLFSALLTYTVVHLYVFLIQQLNPPRSNYWSGVAILSFLCLAVLVLPLTAVLSNLRNEFLALKDRMARTRRGETFVLEQDNLAFMQEGERYSASWDSIAGYHFGHRETGKFTLTSIMTPGIIRTEDGRAFPLSHRLSQFPLFKYLVRRFAVQGIEAQIVANEQEAVGGVAARWTGGEEGKGDRRYHARLRSRRNGLWFWWGISILYTGYFLASRDTPVFQYFVGLGLLLITNLNTLSYWREWVRIGANGIVIQKVFGQTVVAWEDIIEVTVGYNHLILMLKDGQHVAIHITNFAYGNEMKDRIDEHLRQRDHRRAQEEVPEQEEAPEVVNIPAQTTIPSEDAAVIQTVGIRRE